ncbi:MAG: Pycsar system effector family protein [Ginsengibacter sp.]
MNYDLLVNEAEAFVSKYMRKHDNQKLLFHNLAQTQNILLVASEIAAYYSLNEKDLFIVKATGWFLYAGYYKDFLLPEETGSNMAEEFFKSSGLENDTIGSIKKCILATKPGAAPETLSEEIICDANSFYFGTENFSGYNKLRRKEYGLLNKMEVNKNEWTRNTIQMLEAHKYYTDYCESRLNTAKQKNLDKLRIKNPLLSLTANPIGSILNDKNGIKEVGDLSMEKNKERKINSAERTVETMFRTTSTNSQRLSSQADTKAHIMISVNTIIISLMLGLRLFAQPSKLTIPVVMLLIVNLVTIIFSVLATRPNIANRKFSESDFEQNKVNLLFFGNFFSMNFDSYTSAMLHLMEDKQSLHITMLRNLYEQGAVLAKKYKLLKISYNVFMYGLVLSVISFFIASSFL